MLIRYGKVTRKDKIKYHDASFYLPNGCIFACGLGQWYVKETDSQEIVLYSTFYVTALGFCPVNLNSN
jgi:hypothetical protein